MTNQNWARIPQELRDTPQWCIAAPDKAPYQVDGAPAKVNDSDTWAPYDIVADTAARWGSGVGFVLSPDDGFTCIDLDVKEGTTPEEVARYHKIIQAFGSYTEKSRSGKGFHIWVRGKVPSGARRDGVEIYPHERFIICTGDVHLAVPIVANDHMLQTLYAEIRAAQQDETIELVEVEQTDADAVIYQRATEATNGAKFVELWQGQWNGKPEYPSQSEADLSLLSMLAFYSKSNAQVRRMFRLSELGKREKATKNDKYLNRTLSVIRARQERQNAAVNVLMAQGDAFLKSKSTAVNVAAWMGSTKVLEAPHQLDWPPGTVGAVAQYLYSIAPRPVREVAIVSALGLFAGFFGRAYQVLGSGLNLYIVLVARSAIGKEAMHSGLSKLLNHIAFTLGGEATKYVDFADYASGPALVKTLAERSSFVNVAGEFGRKLRKMSDDHDAGPMSGLRTVMTNLYQKSSVGTIVGGIGYSDKEKDVKSTDGVAYSMIGETTPDTFYESLTNTMMQDGFMSRFLIIEHVGLRPELNLNQAVPVPDWIIPYFANLLGGLTKLAPSQYYAVEHDDDAAQLLAEFNKNCDTEINGTDDESWRQMWNRAHLKALKISAILAVADNPALPIVKRVHAEWALDVVKRDIRIMSRKMQDGDIGSDDMSRERKLISVIVSFLKNPVSHGYNVTEGMRAAGIIPRKYMQMRTARVNSFLKDRRGQIAALDTTLRSLMDNGYIAEVPRDKIPAEWGSSGRCFKVIYLPDVYWK